MANILVPERYSHDVLRGDLEYIQVLRLRIRETVDKDECPLFLVKELEVKLEAFNKHFEEHDAEMQFVDKLVREHQQAQAIIGKLLFVGKIAAAVVAIVSAYMMLK